MEVNSISNREAIYESEQKDSLSNFDYRELLEENRRLTNKIKILENQINNEVKFRQSEVTHSEKIGSIYREMHREIRAEQGKEFATLRNLAEHQQHSINKYLLEIKSLREAIRERDYDHAIQIRNQVEKFNNINDSLQKLNNRTEVSKEISNQMFEKEKNIYELEIKVERLNSIIENKDKQLQDELKFNLQKEDEIRDLNSQMETLNQAIENLTNKFNDLSKVKSSVELEKEHFHKAYTQMKEKLESESIRSREALQAKDALKNELVRADEELKRLKQHIEVKNSEIEILTKKTKDKDKIIKEKSTENSLYLKNIDELKEELILKVKELQEELLGYLNETESLIIKIDKQSQQYKVLESKYNNLKNSRLGKLTVKYWSLRNMSKRKG